MLQFISRFTSILFILFLSVHSLFGQEVGEIFTASKADNLFGEVIESFELKTSDLERMLDMCSDYIMFRLEDGELHILDGKRNILHSNKQFIDDSVIFKLYSKTKVEELILLGGEETTTFENRKEVFSVTNGLTTLERSFPCPPWCNYDTPIYYSIHIR